MNRFPTDTPKKHRFHRFKTKMLRQVLSCIIVSLTGICMLLYGLSSVSDSADASQADSLKKAILRSAVHCYAVEGRYPESLSILQETYGIEWDSTRYTVDYEIFASNMMPTVTVIPHS